MMMKNIMSSMVTTGTMAKNRNLKKKKLFKNPMKKKV